MHSHCLPHRLVLDRFEVQSMDMLVGRGTLLSACHSTTGDPQAIIAHKMDVEMTPTHLFTQSAGMYEDICSLSILPNEKEVVLGMPLQSSCSFALLAHPLIGVCPFVPEDVCLCARVCNRYCLCNICLVSMAITACCRCVKLVH
jgi:hypothetical protein